MVEKITWWLCLDCDTVFECKRKVSKTMNIDVSTYPEGTREYKWIDFANRSYNTVKLSELVSTTTTLDHILVGPDWHEDGSYTLSYPVERTPAEIKEWDRRRELERKLKIAADEHAEKEKLAKKQLKETAKKEKAAALQTIQELTKKEALGTRLSREEKIALKNAYKIYGKYA